MSDSERTRTREREPGEERTYDKMLAYYRERVERNAMGPVVIPGRPRGRALRQGRIRYYLNHQIHKDTPLQQWLVFSHELRTTSGKHKHQGGLVIYVIEGRGYSMVDGERWEWEAGDLMLLPLRPEGVEHQHFNLDTEKPSTWIAFINTPISEHPGPRDDPDADSPEFRG